MNAVNPNNLDQLSIVGGSGSDTIAIPNINDTDFQDLNLPTLRGGTGNDSIVGSCLEDFGALDDGDEIYGDDGHDTLIGGSGLDEIFGGAGNDDLYHGTVAQGNAADGFADDLDGGTGTDSSFSNGVDGDTENNIP